MDEQADDIADTLEELTRTLADLRTELESRPRRRPEPRLRPPTPREVLQFTDEVALPALIAIVEANLRTLEAAQRGLSLLRKEQEGRKRVVEAGDQATALRETTLEQLDGALAGLQEALAGGDRPRDEQARSLIQEARQLQTEIDQRLREAVDGERPNNDSLTATEPRRIEIEDESDADSMPSETDLTDDSRSGSDVDVDAELETLKDEYGSADSSDEGDVEDDGDAEADTDPTQSENDGDEQAEEPKTDRRDVDANSGSDSDSSDRSDTDPDADSA